MATVGDTASHLFITERRFYELLDQGVIDRQQPGAYDKDTVREQYISHLREIASGRASLEGSPDLTAERTRLAKEQADAQGLKNAVTRGELVEIEGVAKIVSDEYAIVRTNLLGMPSSVALELVGLDAAEIQERLYAKVTQILTSLSADEEFAQDCNHSVICE